MSALSDIRAAIKAASEGPTRAALRGARPRFKVVVGISAEKSIMCSTHDHRFPIYIDGCVVERTEAFKGWEVVEL